MKKIAIVMVASVIAAACSRTEAPQQTASSVPIDPNKRCVVFLHGKGRTGQPSTVVGDMTYLRPTGNADGWAARQWLYYPDNQYRAVRDVITSAIDSAGCGQVIVQGFSNGAAAAAKLYCRGERFNGRVKGYILDDPVPDRAVESCAPPQDVRVRLYWTRALLIATDGWSCATQDWTCEGGRTIGIEKYAQALGTEMRRSIHITHTEYESPPEIPAWFAPLLRP